MFVVSGEGRQVIMAGIFVVLACLAPILLRTIYRIIKKKLDRSSSSSSSRVYGQLHCVNNRSSIVSILIELGIQSIGLKLSFVCLFSFLVNIKLEQMTRV